ncbi:MAG: hypothetical protein M3Q30_11395 [Actinomycetota bacterium]|nr:hypothetical protein [Actinomycetota bacterium]
MDDGVGDGRPKHAGDDLVHLFLSRRPELMWRMRHLLSPEVCALVIAAVEKIAAELPRAAEATDEQHHDNAYVEIFRRSLAAQVDLTCKQARADLASVAMASIRNADENARRLRRGRVLRRSNQPVDPKLRATTEMILAMPVDDRLRQLEAESIFFSSIRPIDG